MKKVIIFIISLILLGVSLNFKNLSILAFVSSTLKLEEGNKIFQGIFESYDFIIWSCFITISLPFKTLNSSRVIAGITLLLSCIGLFANFIKFSPTFLIQSICYLIATIVYFKIVNKYDFMKKVKDEKIIFLDDKKLVWQSSLYVLLFSIIMTISIAGSVFSMYFLIDAPIWTILIVLPLGEIFVFALLQKLFQSIGIYLENKLNVHPSIVRSLYISSILTIIVMLSCFVALPGGFFSGIGFFRVIANCSIMFFAFRIFAVSIFQFQNNISRQYQKAIANKKEEFEYEDLNYKIENDYLISNIK